MNKIFLLTSTLVVLSCTSDNKIVGKWSYSNVSGNSVTTEVCEYVENNTETCNEELELMLPSGDKVKIQYLTTQEWQLKDGKLLEKNVDVKILDIAINDESLPLNDSRYQETENTIIKRHPKGKSSSRKIVFNGNTFDLYGSSGAPTTFTRVR